MGQPLSQGWGQRKNNGDSLHTRLTTETSFPNSSGLREIFSLRGLGVCMVVALTGEYPHDQGSFSRLKRGKKRRFSCILSGPQRPTFLCPLAKNCWLLLDIFLFISALRFKDSGGAQVSARKIEGTKKQEMRCLMSHSLSSDFPQSTYFLTSRSSQIDATHILFRFFHCNWWERMCLLHISSMGRLNCVFK